MKIYLVWYEENKMCSVVEVTDIVDDANRQEPSMPRSLLINHIQKILGSDKVIMSDTEEEMLSAFPSDAQVVYSSKEAN